MKNAINIKPISKSYVVKRIRNSDISDVLLISRGNPAYYKYCPPEANYEAIISDLKALPPGKTIEDKFYVGFWDDETLIAVMDIVINYPIDETIFIGFFMVAKEVQGIGVGSTIIKEFIESLKGKFRIIRLAYVKENYQAKNFWGKLGFTEIGKVAKNDIYEAVFLEKQI